MCDTTVSKLGTEVTQARLALLVLTLINLLAVKQGPYTG